MSRARSARVRAVRAADTELIGLHRRIGRLILDCQAAQGWGARVIERRAADLRAECPSMRGLSRSNLSYLRSPAGTWPQEAIGHQAAGRLPWGHVTILLDELDTTAEQDWYAAAAVQHGWSRDVLAHQIATRLHSRAGSAPSNFDQRLPAADPDLARAMLRDPYVLDFPDLTERAGERESEAALVDRLQAFLLELETGRFKPEHVGQLGSHVAWVEDNLRTQAHAPTVGILLCAGRNERVVGCALPTAVRELVPTDDQLAEALGPTPPE